MGQGSPASHRWRRPIRRTKPIRMSTLFLCHRAALDHQTPLGHPERADRIRAVERILEQERFQSLVREQAPMAGLEVIARAHLMFYIDNIRECAPREGLM